MSLHSFHSFSINPLLLFPSLFPHPLPFSSHIPPTSLASPLRFVRHLSQSTKERPLAASKEDARHQMSCNNVGWRLGPIRQTSDGVSGQLDKRHKFENRLACSSSSSTSSSLVRLRIFTSSSSSAASLSSAC